MPSFVMVGACLCTSACIQSDSGNRLVYTCAGARVLICIMYHHHYHHHCGCSSWHL